MTLSAGLEKEDLQNSALWLVGEWTSPSNKPFIDADLRMFQNQSQLPTNHEMVRGEISGFSPHLIIKDMITIHGFFYASKSLVFRISGNGEL